ncbi:hypothetical protein NDU88_005944 [Pleurodeles waltl]|uniref:Uncharacterized protein n=1 Tax=Pleurodeles waltl TaxID=8319 RepID=A0AAV7L6B6_PLEWA|nr:hypothetical protein NDU88_005944 [Pleurodeles waltl]
MSRSGLPVTSHCDKFTPATKAISKLFLFHKMVLASRYPWATQRPLNYNVSGHRALPEPVGEFKVQSRTVALLKMTEHTQPEPGKKTVLESVLELPKLEQTKKPLPETVFDLPKLEQTKKPLPETVLKLLNRSTPCKHYPKPF